VTPKIREALNDRGVRTARGGAWHDSTVRNLLGRAERPSGPWWLLSKKAADIADIIWRRKLTRTRRRIHASVSRAESLSTVGKSFRKLFSGFGELVERIAVKLDIIRDVAICGNVVWKIFGPHGSVRAEIEAVFTKIDHPTVRNLMTPVTIFQNLIHELAEAAAIFSVDVRPYGVLD
jgi:hypothetical protein